MRRIFSTLFQIIEPGPFDYRDVQNRECCTVVPETFGFQTLPLTGEVVWRFQTGCSGCTQPKESNRSGAGFVGVLAEEKDWGNMASGVSAAVEVLE